MTYELSYADCIRPTLSSGDPVHVLRNNGGFVDYPAFRTRPYGSPKGCLRGLLQTA